MIDKIKVSHNKIFKILVVSCLVLVCLSSLLIPAFASSADDILYFKGDEWHITFGKGPVYVNNIPTYEATNDTQGRLSIALDIQVPSTGINSSNTYELTYSIYNRIGKASTGYISTSFGLIFMSDDKILDSLVVVDLKNPYKGSAYTVSKTNQVKSFNIPQGTTKISLITTSDCREVTDTKYPYYSFGLYNLKLSGYNVDQKIVEGFAQANQNLDNINDSVQQGADKVADAINPDIPYSKPSDSGLHEAVQDFQDATSKLPKVDLNILDDLFNSVDLSKLNHAFLAVNQVFDKFINVTGFHYLILFSLILGTALFILGRTIDKRS